MKSHCLMLLLLTTTILLAPQLLSGTSKSEEDVNEIGNRRIAHRSIISEEKEVAIGKQYAAQVERTAKLLKDPVVSEYINRIAQNLGRNSDLQIPVTAKVIDNPAINAFALPGGFLYVNSGLILAADGEDQIAGVMAHEIAHVAARHWASQMTKQTILRYATLPLIFTPMSYPVYMGVSEAMNFGIPLAFLKFSRAAEAEADYLGIQYMYKAGYDPNAYVAFFGKVIDQERRQPGSVSSIFMDHPLTPDRVIKAEEEIKDILPNRDEYMVTTSEFNDVKSRLQTVVAELRKGRESGPTLKKRQPTDTTGTQDGGNNKNDDDQPPVLRRRD
jgi:predicted Zn-dependent protease